MIICACAARNDDYIIEFVQNYLQGIHTITDKVLIDIRIKLNQAGDDRVGCGTCLGAIRKIVFEVVETLQWKIEIHASAQIPQEELRDQYKLLAIKVIS
jgi:bacterioferritin-associated ferredoxin